MRLFRVIFVLEKRIISTPAGRTGWAASGDRPALLV